MGRPDGWMKELTGRSPMKSAGAPSHRREVEREFWITTGITSEAAAAAVEVSQAVGSLWFRHLGGMPPMDLNEPTGSYLSSADREEIAPLRAKTTGCERSRARSIGRHRRFLASCAATPQPGAASLGIGRRSLNGSLSWSRSTRSHASWSRTPAAHLCSGPIVRRGERFRWRTARSGGDALNWAE